MGRHFRPPLPLAPLESIFPPVRKLQKLRKFGRSFGAQWNFADDQRAFGGQFSELAVDSTDGILNIRLNLNRFITQVWAIRLARPCEQHARIHTIMVALE